MMHKLGRPGAVKAKSPLSIEDKARMLGKSKWAYLEMRAIANLRRFIDGRFVSLTIVLLILISVFLIFAEFLIQPGPTYERIVALNDLLTWFFIYELSLRYIIAPNKKIFFSNYWIDILAVLPVLRVFRAFRVLRLLRLLRLYRAGLILMQQSGWVSASFRRYFGSFGALLLTAIMLIMCGTLALLTFERPMHVSFDSFVDSIWITTFLFISGEMIGEVPVTPMGKLAAALISVAGLVVFAVMVGTIAASMAQYFRGKMDNKDVTIDDLHDHLIICGWDRMGRVILNEIEAREDVWARGVVIIAETEEDIETKTNIKDARRVFHVRADFTAMEVLEDCGAKRAKTAIVLADKGQNLGDQDRDARTVLAALTLEKLNPQIFTCAELLSEKNATHLRVAGVEEIITRTRITAGLFAASVVNDGVTSVISDILTHHEGSYFKKIPVPKDYVRKPFIEVYNYLKREFDAMVIAIEVSDEHGRYRQSVNPPYTQMMNESDRLTLILKRDSAISDILQH